MAPFTVWRGVNRAIATLGIHAHLFAHDHFNAMAALGAMTSRVSARNVVRLRSRRNQITGW